MNITKFAHVVAIDAKPSIAATTWNVLIVL